MADWQWWMLGYKVLGLQSMIMVHKDRRIEFRSQGSSRAEVKLSIKKWILRTLNIYNWWRLVSISVFKVHISTKLAISVSYPAILLQHIIFSVCLIIFTSLFRVWLSRAVAPCPRVALVVMVVMVPWYWEVKSVKCADQGWDGHLWSPMVTYGHLWSHGLVIQPPMVILIIWLFTFHDRKWGDKVLRRWCDDCICAGKISTVAILRQKYTAGRNW